MRYINFKGLLLFLLISILTLPLLEKIFKFSISELAELKGAYHTPQLPEISLQSFLKSEMQDSLSAYIEANISNRNALVRLRNQIAFSVFKESPNKELVIGRENYLFEKIYIDFYTGHTWFDSSWMNKRIELLKDVVDSLKKNNVDLVVVFAPSKASVCNEFIPTKYTRNFERDLIYKTCSGLLRESKIPFIDFNHYYILNTGKLNFNVFPKGNAHWTYYAATHAVDSITQFIINQFNIPLYKYSWYVPPFTDKHNFQEGDLAQTLNLLNPFKEGEYLYPSIVIEDTFNCVKPEVVIIGDSFSWTMLFTCFNQKLFAPDFEFWDYNTKIWSPYKNETELLSERDYKSELLKRRVIIIVEGALHYSEIGHGFIDKTYELFHPIK